MRTTKVTVIAFKSINRMTHMFHHVSPPKLQGNSADCQVSKSDPISSVPAISTCAVWQWFVWKKNARNPLFWAFSKWWFSGKKFSNQFCGELCDLFIYGPVSKWGMPMKWTTFLWKMMRNHRIHVQTKQYFRHQRPKHRPNWSKLKD